MTLDGFLTLLTLLVAIYALLPRVTKLRVRLGIGLQISLAIIAFLLVLYVQFNTQVIRLCTTVPGRACGWLPSFSGDLFTPPELSFILVLIWMILAWAIHKFFSRPLAHSSLPTVSKIVADLIYEQHYAELIELVKPRLPFIDRACRRSLCLQKLHDNIRSMKSENVRQLQRYIQKRRASGREDLPGEIVTKVRRGIGNLAIVVPAQRQVETAATDIVRALCQSKDLRNYVIEARPYFALSVLQMPMLEVNNFSDAYFTGLISDPNSILYQEFEKNSQHSAGIRPREDNRILGFLFNDASVAEKLAVWRPIGKYMLALLQSRESPDLEFTASLSRKAENFNDERWRNPISAGIYFFDVMVTAAAMQRIRWHMWLYYFLDITERLEKLYDTSDPEVNESDEFPTRSARLIYEAIDVLQDWILLVKRLPKDSPHMSSDVLDRCTDHDRDPQAHQPFYDNGNIPVSAVNTLGFCMKKIVLSERIGEQFKVYIYETVVRTIRKLEDPWRSLLIQSTVRGGSPIPLCKEYGRRSLCEILPQIDHVHRERVIADLKDELRRTYRDE